MFDTRLAATLAGLWFIKESADEAERNMKPVREKMVWVESKQWPGWREHLTKSEARRRGYTRRDFKDS